MQARMSLSLLWELSFGSTTSGYGRRTCTVNRRIPASATSRLGCLLGMITMVAGPGGDAGVLVRRALHPPGHHQPYVHAVGHAVGLQRGVGGAAQLVPAEPDVEGDGGRALVEPVEVALEEHRVAAVRPQALPYAVAEHEAGVEHRHHRLGPGVSRPFTQTRMPSLRGSSSYSCTPWTWSKAWGQ